MQDRDVYDLNGQLLPNGHAITSSICMYEDLYKAYLRKPFDPIDVDLGSEFVRLRRILFSILMAHARANDLEFVSIGPFDLIAPKIKHLTSFDRNFAWRFPDIVGIPGSCGNGIGKTCAQYQISMTRWFNMNQLGVYDPHTERQWSTNSFVLWSKSDGIDNLVAAVRNGESGEQFIRKNETIFEKVSR